MSYIAIVRRACDMSYKRPEGTYLRGDFPIEIREYSSYLTALECHSKGDVFSMADYFEYLDDIICMQKTPKEVAVKSKGFWAWMKALFKAS